MKTPHLWLYFSFVVLSACNPGGTSIKYDEGPLELFLGVSYSGEVSEAGTSYYWVSGTNSGYQYTVTMYDTRSSVDLTLEFCSSTCVTTTCNSGRNSQCSASIVSDGQQLAVNVYGGSNLILNQSEYQLINADSNSIQPKANVVRGRYSILIE